MKTTTPPQPLGPYGALFLGLLALVWAARVLLSHGIALALLLAGYRPSPAHQKEAPTPEPQRSGISSSKGSKRARRSTVAPAAAA